MENAKMEKIALVTGADRGLGLALCAGLLERGWNVFAGQYLPDWPELAALAQRSGGLLNILPLDVASLESARRAAHAVRQAAPGIDLLINNAGVISPKTGQAIQDGLDYAEMHRLIDVNAVGPLRVVECFLPLMADRALKRLCFVSSEAGSIGRCRRDAWYDYCMSKAALNMGVRILFNDLRRQGFTFRVYHPGWVRSYMNGAKNLSADMEPEEAAAKALPIFLGERADEDRLVMVDYQGVEWPW
jgi:NAD(P)-dependent dehydrogenase (short-subunit alcohol dehydrogenase family)